MSLRREILYQVRGTVARGHGSQSGVDCAERFIQVPLRLRCIINNQCRGCCGQRRGSERDELKRVRGYIRGCRAYFKGLCALNLLFEIGKTNNHVFRFRLDIEQ